MMRIFFLSAFAVAAVILSGLACAGEAVVETECDIFTLLPPENGSGPLWSYGCTQVARLGDDVFVSIMETGEGVPLLSNTRWRLMRISGGEQKIVAEADGYRQREPASLAAVPPDRLFLYVNDSQEAPGVKYGHCLPHLLSFSGEKYRQKALFPKWDRKHHFTDHSYRGYAADAASGHLLMLNIDATTSVQNACLMNSKGKTLATGSITFPVRACYPQVAVRDKAVQVLAVGDIVEPVDAWREYKFEQTKQQWDYVFRRLFLVGTPDLSRESFGAVLEIDSVDDTGGHITNQDLWVSPEGEAWVLYSRREVQNELMRDKFFPEKSVIDSLWLVRVRNGEITHKELLVEGTEESRPAQARFQETPDGALHVILYLTGADAGNKALRVFPETKERVLLPLPLQEPLPSFCLANTRSGNASSYMVDFYGTPGNNRFRYAGVRLPQSEK